MTMKRIYFDNNATTPLDPAALEAMLPFLETHFGNPSSAHRFGEIAKHAVDVAREQTAALINTTPDCLIFTSGGSEANNMAIRSAIEAYPEKKHIISSQVEHPSILSPLQFLAQKGYEIELLPVDTDGRLDLEKLAAVIRPDTAIVTLMAANNETGVLWPLEKIGAICREKSVLFLSDAVQMAGKKAIDLQTLPVDYLSMAAHKVHGPKGVGALYAQRNAPVTPLIMGAGQEHGRRAGTENVAGIVGFGKASEIADQGLEEKEKRIQELRDLLEKTLFETIPDLKINGAPLPRLVNTTNISFKNVAAAAVIQELDEKGIAVSAHSACHSGDLDPSHVLTAMSIPETYLHGTLRISLSRFNSHDEIETLAAILPGIINKSRQYSIF